MLIRAVYTRTDRCATKSLSQLMICSTLTRWKRRHFSEKWTSMQCFLGEWFLNLDFLSSEVIFQTTIEAASEQAKKVNGRIVNGISTLSIETRPRLGSLDLVLYRVHWLLYPLVFIARSRTGRLDGAAFPFAPWNSAQSPALTHTLAYLKRLLFIQWNSSISAF